jgi:hypothetical protein
MYSLNALNYLCMYNVNITQIVLLYLFGNDKKKVYMCSTNAFPHPSPPNIFIPQLVEYIDL